MRSQPEVAATGASPDGIWALFSNGIPVFLFDLDLLGPTSDAGAGLAPLPAPAPEGLPTALQTAVPSSRRAVLVDAMGPAFDPWRSRIAGPLQDKGYEVTEDPGTVESLRALPSAGVFFFSSHGGRVRTATYDDADTMLRDQEGKPRHGLAFGVMTTTPFDRTRISAYEADLFSGRLGFGDALDRYASDGGKVNEARYFVTDRFARKYWSFSQDALVWIDTCNGQSPEAAAFRDACLKRNLNGTAAGLYVGWTGVTGSRAAKKALEFMVPRLLGANDPALPTEDPPQRSFAYTELWTNLIARGLDSAVFDSQTSGSQTTRLVYTASGSSNFGMLAPSIKYVLIDELHDEAILLGSFGPRILDEVFVRIDNVDVQIEDWTENRVVVALPRSGPGSSGPVVATVRRHDSNTRHITEWRMALNYWFRDASLDPCQVAGPVTLRFRADVGDYREAPGTPPIHPVRTAIATRESVASLTASGTHVDAQSKCSTTWSGTGQAAAGLFGSGSPQVLAMMEVDSLTIHVGLALAGSSQLPWSVRDDCAGDVPLPLAPPFGTLDVEHSFRSPLEDGRPEMSLPSLVFPLAISDPQNFRIDADRRNSGPDGLTIHLDWARVEPRSPPDPQDAL